MHKLITMGKRVAFYSILSLGSVKTQEMDGENDLNEEKRFTGRIRKMYWGRSVLSSDLEGQGSFQNIRTFETPCARFCGRVWSAWINEIKFTFASGKYLGAQR